MAEEGTVEAAVLVYVDADTRLQQLADALVEDDTHSNTAQSDNSNAAARVSPHLALHCVSLVLSHGNCPRVSLSVSGMRHMARFTALTSISITLSERGAERGMRMRGNSINRRLRQDTSGQ